MRVGAGGTDRRLSKIAFPTIDRPIRYESGRFLGVGLRVSDKLDAPKASYRKLARTESVLEVDRWIWEAKTD